MAHGMKFEELSSTPLIRKIYRTPSVSQRITYPIVVYVPKYDSKLREEFEVKMTKDGKYELWLVQIGRRRTRQLIAVFSNLDQVRQAVISQFYRDFNRDPKGRKNVWQRTIKGRAVVNRVSVHEGSKLVAPSATTMRTIDIERPDNIPTGGVHTKAMRFSPSLLKKLSLVKEERTRKVIGKVKKSKKGKGRHKP
jgi:hypothetical protein